MYPSATPKERRADGAVHFLGMAGVLIGGGTFMALAVMRLEPLLVLACAVYALTLLISFSASACYHMLPWHGGRAGLRRLDHAAIYGLIAGTFTPLLVHVDSLWSYVVLGATWAFALPAMFYKIFGASVDTRWSVLSYLGLGWMGLLALPQLRLHLPTEAIVALVAGGLIYSSGTLFYARRSMRFRYAIWHGFVLAGTAALFAAVALTVFPAGQA